MIKFAETKNEGYTLRGILSEVENSKGLVVMFHGFTGHMNENGYLFKELAAQLADKGYSSVRFDYRGNGISDGRFNEMTFDTVLSDARAMVKYALGLNINKKVIILGFSMGGAAASMVAKEFENDLEKLVLMAPAASMMSSVVGRYRNNPSVNWYNENNVDMGGYLMSKAFIDSFDDLDLYQNTDLHVPVIILHGEKDMAVPIEYGKKYASMYPDCEFYEVKDANHCFQSMSQRKFVNDHILEFLSK